MAGGLPAKPYVPPVGPAPPLPAGPPPPQPGYNQPQQDPAAAHAAAWAAYYQSQGLTATGQPQPAGSYNAIQPQLPPAAGNTSNPYANYGYGAQAAQAHLGTGGPSSRGNHSQQQSYRPPPPQQQQNYAYQPQPQQGYQSPTPYQGVAPQVQGYGGPPQAAGYGQAQSQQWNQPGTQPYRPPQAGPGPVYNGAGPQQPYFNNAGPQQQPYTPPHPGNQTPYRPPTSHSPAPMSQNRPYQPQPQPTPQRPPRPPMNQGPTPPHHPPAKRPRFDGPGPGPGPPPGPSGSGPPARPNLPVRPGSIPARPPSGPRAPLPAPPIMRPPIHLGTGSGPPVFAPGGPRGGAGPMRGMSGDRGRGRGGMMINAPRGPSHMRRERNHDSHHQGQHHRDRDRSRRADASPSKRDRKDAVGGGNKKKDTVKTTMTDFRIVGIEIKELGWTWGLTGAEALAQIPDEKESKEKLPLEDEGPVKSEPKTEPSESEVKADEAEAAPISTVDPIVPGSDDKEVPPEAEIKVEEAADPIASGAAMNAPVTDLETVSDTVKEEATVADDVEGKVGGKRKAQSPEADEGSSKKRSTYLLTHGKANETPSHESNQNRFRIYFESPPEADRIPQALRRNPYKRWRRASSSVAPSRQGDEREREEGKDLDQSSKGDKEKEASDAKLPEVTEEVESAVAADTANPTETDVEPVAAVATEHAVADTTAAPDADIDEAPTIERAVDTDAVGSQPVEAVPGVEASDSTVEPASDVVSLEVPTAGTEGLVSDVAAAANHDDATSPLAGADTTGEAEATSDPNDLGTAETPTIEDGVTTALADAGINVVSSIEDPASAPATATTDAGTSAELASALAQSAENAASAYKSRTRRRSSISSTDSRDTIHAFQPEVTPSTNRLSILYEGSQRRMCFDAEVVDKIRVYREEGRIEVLFKPQREEKEDDDSGDSDTLLPKGFLLETYDQEEQRFAPVFREKLEELYSADDVTDSIPPLHRQLGCPTPPVEPLSINVYLNKKNPLSLPRWCRTNSADEWLFEQFGTKSLSSAQVGWRGKLEVMDPDPPPTLANILENWATSSSVGTSAKRTEFTTSLLSEPYDLLEILLRLTRGDRNPSASSHMATGAGGAGSSLTAAMRSDSPYASHQTHVSLAILAMYRLTTDYAAKAGEKSEVVNEKIGDIIKSLPSGMISRSLDGMFKEWDGKGRDGHRDRK